MSWLTKAIASLLPEDKECTCGYGPFKLPADHPFTPACRIHDWEFVEAHKGTPDKRLAEVDADLFWRWVLIARKQPTPEKQIELYEDAIKYWPLARRFGVFLWEGKE